VFQLVQALFPEIVLGVTGKQFIELRVLLHIAQRGFILVER